MIILMSGPNAVGKSTTASALAGHMKRGTYLEGDLLRVFVMGGLCAWSGGLPPWKHPVEYREQLDLRNLNAITLAANFERNGFHSVIEGLDADTIGPGTGWMDEHIPGLDVRHVAVICDPSLTQQRLIDRGDKPRDLEEYSGWLKEVENADPSFDHVLDTSSKTTMECVQECAAAFDIELDEQTVFGIDWNVIRRP